MRTFISIKIPTKIMMQIQNIQDSLPEPKGKKTELKNLHLTLKFLGEISSEELEKIKTKLSEIKFNKFNAEIKEIGFFDKQDTGIIWLGITNCEKIQEEIDNCLNDIFEKERRFMGHLTIARVKKISNKNKFLDDINKIEVPKMFFLVEKFYLMESELKKE